MSVRSFIRLIRKFFQKLYFDQVKKKRPDLETHINDDINVDPR